VSFEISDEDRRGMRLHCIDLLREAVRNDTYALVRLTEEPPYDFRTLYVALARTAAAALQVGSDTPLQTLDIMRRDVAENG